MPETWPPDRRGKYAKTMRELDERIAALTLCLEKFAAEIEAKDAEITELHVEIADLRSRPYSKEIAKLRAALEPFAELARKFERENPGWYHKAFTFTNPQIEMKLLIDARTAVEQRVTGGKE